jgi:hypothetical protein
MWPACQRVLLDLEDAEMAAGGERQPPDGRILAAARPRARTPRGGAERRYRPTRSLEVAEQAGLVRGRIKVLHRWC